MLICELQTQIDMHVLVRSNEISPFSSGDPGAIGFIFI